MNYFGGSDDDAGGDEDQESSPFQNVEALKCFREQWQRELKISPKHTPKALTKKPQVLDGIASDVKNREDRLKSEEISVEAKAKNLFLQGIENEQSGKLYEAIQFYRRAVQLVPDIEFRLYESTKPKFRSEKMDIMEKKDVEERENDDHENDVEDSVDNDCDILGKLSRIIEKNGYFCFPECEQSTTHISALPMEIFFYILRWVVSSELDIRSLEMVSRVCQGFYVCARDAEIWRMACVRVWGVNCGRYEPKYLSWREMYMQRPRLRYNGCYISKTTYIRHGENSFQDQFYKPWHLVEYFRYLRFFPEGKVLMLTSTDDAQYCVSSLKNRNPRNTSVLIGHYRLRDNCVSLILKRQETKTNTTNFSNRRRKRNEPIHDSGEQTFHVEFEIQNYRKRPNSQLSWLCYIIYTKYKSGEEIPTKLSLGGRYPPFRFNRVKSYTQESEFPLQ
ncbi:F-box only protein 9 [Phymastichus coffea]|uniref:F-box only protein 9 n=1 Tax=Phymastichus coffea TaxID=108790 RepID=UPI00273BA130|nr:F-box only protein 9 [Phymastichus coffea]